jgi:hypothetical protein
MNSVVITGDALEHLKEYSGLISSLMENPNTPNGPEQIVLTAKVLPNGKHDVQFLQAWVNGEIVGEIDEKTGTLKFIRPFKTKKVFQLLDYLTYATPATVTETLIRSGIILPPSPLTLGHGHGRPIARPVPPVSPVSPISPHAYVYRNYSEFHQNDDDNDNNYDNNNNNNNDHKRTRTRYAYVNANANEHTVKTTPWAKRRGTRKTAQSKRSSPRTDRKIHTKRIRTKEKHRQTYKRSGR